VTIGRDFVAFRAKFADDQIIFQSLLQEFRLKVVHNPTVVANQFQSPQPHKLQRAQNQSRKTPRKQ
jgi:hypothetical protein